MDPDQPQYICLYKTKGAAQAAITALLEAGVKCASISHSGNLGWDWVRSVSLTELALPETQRNFLLGGLIVPDLDKCAVAAYLLDKGRKSIGSGRGGQV